MSTHLCTHIDLYHTYLYTEVSSILAYPYTHMSLILPHPYSHLHHVPCAYAVSSSVLTVCVDRGSGDLQEHSRRPYQQLRCRGDSFPAAGAHPHLRQRGRALRHPHQHSHGPRDDVLLRLAGPVQWRPHSVRHCQH